MPDVKRRISDDYRHLLIGTDPTKADTDGDGTDAGLEAKLGTRPGDASHKPARSPVLLVGGNQVSFTYQRGMSPPAAHARYVTPGGTGNLNFTATDAVALLSASPAQGSASGKLTITANPVGKQPCSYIGHVTVAASGAYGNPQQRPIETDELDDPGSKQRPAGRPFGAFATSHPALALRIFCR